MALSTFNSYKTQSEQPAQQILFVQQNFNNVIGRLTSFWTNTPFQGATPSTAQVPASNVSGALGQNNGTNKLFLADMQVQFGVNTGAGMLILCDRLSHQGGLSGTVTTPQTTNLPTASLNRYTGGTGVYAAIEIYSAVGTTPTTLTANYSNQNGVTANTFQTQIGAAGFREQGCFHILPLKNGDVGVRSVNSITATGSTATAGNYGITLFKTLACIPLNNSITPTHFNAMLQGGMQLQQVQNNACLFFLWVAGSNTGAPIQGRLNFIDV